MSFLEDYLQLEWMRLELDRYNRRIYIYENYISVGGKHIRYTELRPRLEILHKLPII